MEITSLEVSGPHAGQPVLLSGEPLASARVAFLLLHGRGAGAADILSLGEEWAVPGVALVAPEAADWTWYPAPSPRRSRRTSRGSHRRSTW